jgi:hypothetical protein
MREGRRTKDAFTTSLTDHKTRRATLLINNIIVVVIVIIVKDVTSWRDNGFAQLFFFFCR